MEVHSPDSRTKSGGRNGERWTNTFQVTVGNLLSHDLKRADLTTQDLHDLSNSLHQQQQLQDNHKNGEAYVSKQTLDDIIREQAKIKKVLHANFDKPSHYDSHDTFLNREKTKYRHGPKRGKIHRSKTRNSIHAENGTSESASANDSKLENLEKTMNINFMGSPNSLNEQDKNNRGECEAVEISKFRVSRIDKNDMESVPSRHFSSKNAKPGIPAYIAKRRALLVKMNSQRFKHVPKPSNSEPQFSGEINLNDKPHIPERKLMERRRSTTKLLQKCLDTYDNYSNNNEEKSDYTAKSFGTLTISLKMPIATVHGESEPLNHLYHSEDSTRRVSSDYNILPREVVDPRSYGPRRASPADYTTPRLRLTRMSTRLNTPPKPLSPVLKIGSPMLMIKPATFEEKNGYGDIGPQKRRDKNSSLLGDSKVIVPNSERNSDSPDPFPEDPYPDEEDEGEDITTESIYEDRFSPLPRSSKFPVIKEQGSSSNNVVTKQDFSDFVPKPYTVLDDNVYARYERTKTTVTNGTSGRHDSKTLDRTHTEDINLNASTSYSSFSTYRAGTTL